VKATEQNAKTRSAEGGFFTTLSGLLPVTGIGVQTPSRLRRSAISLAVLCCALLALFSAGAASAARPVTFCSPGSAAGQCDAPFGVAVDQSSGYVYVADANNSRIDAFDPAGHILRAFGWGVLNGAAELQLCTAICEPGTSGSATGQFQPYAVAVDQSSHDVYVADEAENHRIQKFTANGEFILMFGKEVNKTADANLLSSAAERNVCTAVSGDTCGAGAPGSDPGAVTRSVALALDASNNLWVAEGEHERLEQFSPAGEFIAETPLPGAGEITSLAIDTDASSPSFGDFYTLKSSHGSPNNVVSKRKPSGEPVETLDASGHPNALGLDPATGHLFISDQAKPESHPGAATLLEFDPSGAQIESFGTGNVVGKPFANALAFDDAAQSLYVVSSEGQEGSAAQIFTVPLPGPVLLEGTSRATEIKKTAATLCAKLNPEGVETTFRFQYLTEKQYEEDGKGFGAGTVETVASAPIGTDFEAHEACQPVSPLTPATAYRFRILATNVNGSVTGETASFQALPPAAIDSTSVVDVTSASATFEAQVNPLGDATAYRFEYIAEAAYLENEAAGEPPFSGAARAPLTDVPIGAGEEDVSVSQHVRGLAPHTAYRYRLLATNVLAPDGYAGPVLAFTTQASGAFGLPDARGWELVSPPDKFGASLESFNEANVLVQSAVSGYAVTYFANGPTEPEPQGFQTRVRVLSTRGPNGWASRDISPPHSEAVQNTVFVIGGDHEDQVFSSDLSVGLIQPFGRFEPSLSSEATEQTPYLRTNFPSSDPTALCAESCYRPIVDAGDVPADTHFSTEGACPGHPPQLSCGPHIGVGSPDLRHVLLLSQVALTSIPLPAKTNDGIYEFSAERPATEALQLISVLPDGQPAAYPGIGARPWVISRDGARILFESSGHLYLRDNAPQPQSAVNGSGQCSQAVKACTIQLDTVQEGATGGGQSGAQPQFASTDGSVVFFTDSQRLTPDSGGMPGEPDLYRCQIVAVAGQLHCDLTDITPLVSGESAAVQGQIMGASSDGASLYFVANGVLSGEETNERGERARPGHCTGLSTPGAMCNLYIYRDGAVRFVAVLADADRLTARGSGDLEWLATNARVSPNGRWLAFMSERPLTGYDNRDALSGRPDEEVYLYDAESGRLRCVSCNPTGARPRGWEFEDRLEEALGGNRAWNSREGFFAALLPGWPVPGYSMRLLSDSGRLFFDSFEGLDPQDSNGTWDVYQYEPPGAGDCSESSPTFAERSGGCVGLISSGVSPEPSIFLDASESGNDVFFYTNARLSPLDVDTSRDVYDARVGGGFAEPVPPPACEGDACQSPAAPPEDPTPGSLTFQGTGNLLASAPKPAVKPRLSPRARKLASALKACGRKPKKKRPACERQARRAYQPAGKAKKSNRRTH
jgi:hypothetical protein